jgi:hypothetical protein
MFRSDVHGVAQRASAIVIELTLRRMKPSMTMGSCIVSFLCVAARVRHGYYVFAMRPTLQCAR